MLPHRRDILILLACLCLLPVAVSAQEDDHHDAPAKAESAEHGNTHAGHASDDAHGEGDHGAEHGEGDHGDGHHEYTIWGDLPFWSLIAFIGFVVAIKVLGLWDLLLSSMSAREQAENEAISIAENDLAASQSVLKEVRGRMESLDETIRETLAEADRDATGTRTDILAEAEKEANASVERARHDIQRVRDQSLNELFSSLAEKVSAVTESRLRDGLNDDDQRRLIDQTLGQLSAN
ncbi:MAG: ATP synthase F0 subunit B [Planctomycetaceae bacterium]|nr:ATP synthase F0 subunit B [Planctomycetaceae bacterium]